MRLYQIIDAALSHCEGCEHHRGHDRMTIDCAAREDRVGTHRDKCPAGKWDHSELPATRKPVKTPAPTRVAIPASHVGICYGRHLEWPARIWQRFLDEGKLVGSQVSIPRELYNELKHHWINPNE